MAAIQPIKMGRRNIGAMQNRDNLPRDDVKKQLGFALKIAAINTGRVKSPDELADRFKQLFDLSFEEGILPRYEHLVLVSGLPKSTFYDYGNENYQYVPDPRYSEVIKGAKALISASEAGLASTGKIPAPVYIFRAKNYEGLKDVQEIQAGPIQDPTKPTNASDILNALPEIPISSASEEQKKD